MLIDTSIAIELRDRNAPILDRLATLDGLPSLSVVSLVELEGGVYVDPKLTQARRVRLDALLVELPVLDFDAECVGRYRAIVELAGFSRRKIVDRMIAATALRHGSPSSRARRRISATCRGCGSRSGSEKPGQVRLGH